MAMCLPLSEMRRQKHRRTKVQSAHRLHLNARYMNVKDFIFNLPNKVDPQAVEGLSTLFHFDVADAGQFTIRLLDGKLNVSEGLEGEPKCKVNASSETLSKLLSGDLNPTMAMMTGKLKISNLSEMLKYAKVFGLM